MRAFITFLALALMAATQAQAKSPDPHTTLKAIAHCAPAGPCAAHLPVKIVIITLFEIGKDEGDAPGEFQLWKARRHLTARIPFPQGYHDLYYNPDTQVLGIVTGMGNIKSATATLALGLDQRLDLRKAYWLVAGIAGIDPAAAPVGSAAWARYLVDGDMGHEIDPREIPATWKWGYFPVHGAANPAADPLADPLATPAPKPENGEMYALNASLANWAYGLTKDIKLQDDPTLDAQRKLYAAFPEAQKPPHVLMGDQLAAMTFWHGEKMTGWARDWVAYWTKGQGTFVTSAMEETGTYQSLLYLTKAHRADASRFMVLRAGSNYTMPPPGITAADNMARENEGYTGMSVALESLYKTASVVVDELLAHWPQYEKTPPK